VGALGPSAWGHQTPGAVLGLTEQSSPSEALERGLLGGAAVGAAAVAIAWLLMGSR
jgi:hypothetical protein